MTHVGVAWQQGNAKVLLRVLWLTPARRAVVVMVDREPWSKMAVAAVCMLSPTETCSYLFLRDDAYTAGIVTPRSRSCEGVH